MKIFELGSVIFLVFIYFGVFVSLINSTRAHPDTSQPSIKIGSDDGTSPTDKIIGIIDIRYIWEYP